MLDQVGVIYVTGTSNANLFTEGTDSHTDFLSGDMTFTDGDKKLGPATTDNWKDQSFPNLSNNHVFFAQIDPSGQNLLQATIAGGGGDDQGKSLSVAGYCFSQQPNKPFSYPACVGTASIVGSAVETTQDEGLFGTAAVTFLYPLFPPPPLPTKAPSSATSGFFVQEELAGFCNMQLQQQQGSSVTLGGPCVSGTTNGKVNVTDKNGKVTTVNIPISGISSLSPSGAVTLDLGLSGIQPFTLTFSFLPLGAIGAVGDSQLDDNEIVLGCPIIQTGGGGAGTIFNVTYGTFSVVVSCSGANCNYNGLPNTVLIRQPVTLNAAVTNGFPNTVTWSSSAGTFSGPNPSTSITFTPGGTGGPIVVTATPVANTSVSPAPTITLNTFEPTSVSFANNGPFTYGPTNITINVSSSAGSSFTPTGNILYQVDNGVNGSGTLTLSGGSVPIQLASLSAGSHSLAVSYPGDAASFLVNSSNTLTLTVQKAPLTVTATSPPPITFGQAIPALTYATPTGFVNGDSASVISGTATVSTTATSTSTPGDYPITFSTMALAATNYSFNYVNGTLTISPVGAASAPIISPMGGSYTSAQTGYMNITGSVAGAKFYYTTDGTAPTETSASYTGPIAVGASETIRAIAVAVGYQNSAITNATFNLLSPTLSASLVSFGSIAQGVLSSAQSILLTNPGANSLGGLTLKLGGADAGEFALASGTTCGTTLAGNSSCAIAVAFTPASTGTRSAALAISYLGLGSPLVLNLGGIGASPLSVTSSATQFVAGTTFQFTASAPATWTVTAGTITSSGFFTSPNPISAPVQITVTATSLSNTQILAATQITVVPAPAIVVPSTTTLPAGSSISIPISISAGGIAGEAMTFSCVPATLPTGVSCFFTPNPVVNAGGAKLALQLFSNSTGNNLPTREDPWRRYPRDSYLAVAAGCLLMCGRKKYRGKMIMALAVTLGSATLLSVTACGTSGSFNGTTQGGHVTGTYTINISAAGASPGSADYNQTLTTVPLKVVLQ